MQGAGAGWAGIERSWHGRGRHHPGKHQLKESIKVSPACTLCASRAVRALYIHHWAAVSPLLLQGSVETCQFLCVFLDLFHRL